MNVESCLHKVLVCLFLSVHGIVLVASNKIDVSKPPYPLNNKGLPEVSNIPARGTGRPIIKTQTEKMHEAFDALIYKNKTDEMSSILNRPDLFTAQYGLPAMTAKELCNMRRRNTDNISLHIAAAAAYKDISMTKLLLDRGADIEAKNIQGWTPLHHPYNINVSKYLIKRGALGVEKREGFYLTWDRLTCAEIEGDIAYKMIETASAYSMAQIYKNKKKMNILKHANDLLAACLIIEGKPHGKMSLELDPAVKQEFLLDAIFVDRKKPSFKALHLQDEVPQRAALRMLKSPLKLIREESDEDVLAVGMINRVFKDHNPSFKACSTEKKLHIKAFTPIKSMPLESIKEETLKQIADEQESVRQVIVPAIPVKEEPVRKPIDFFTSAKKESLLKDIEQKEVVERLIAPTAPFSMGTSSNVSTGTKRAKASAVRAKKLKCGKQEIFAKQEFDFVMNPCTAMPLREGLGVRFNELVETKFFHMNDADTAKNPLHEQQQVSPLKKLVSTKHLSSPNLLEGYDDESN